MILRPGVRLLAVIAAGLFAGLACGRSDRPSGVVIEAARSADRVGRYDLFELSFKHNVIYRDRFHDFTVEVSLAGPSGRQHRVKGFFYGGDLWKARFRPDEAGTWRYAYVLTGTGDFREEGEGRFECVDAAGDGPVRRNPANPYTWVFASGRPYYPIGLQDCILLDQGQPVGIVIDGGTEPRSAEKPPVSIDRYFATYGPAGFNLFRFSQQNCSYPLFDDLDHYRQPEGIVTDMILSRARQHGLRVMFGIFGFYEVQPGNEARERQFIEYCVARWGAYVDFWELLNESHAPAEWTREMARHLRSIDPESRPIATSWERPDLDEVDINAPHWYETEDERQSDARVAAQAAVWKQAGKPVIVGEQGNVGRNWDPTSGVRMRIRTWTALFQQIGLVFWNTSWSKTRNRYTFGRPANIYLGPEEREYVRVLDRFAKRLDPGAAPVAVQVSPPDRARAYALASSRALALYVHHFGSHRDALQGARVTVSPASPLPAGALAGEWIDPATGRVLGGAGLVAPERLFSVPPFAVDAALLLTVSEKGQ